MVWHNYNIEKDFEKTFDEIYKKIDYKQSIDDNRSERSYVLFKIAKELSSINADFVECGPYAGISSYYMAKNCRTTLHLFDSWEGVSEVGELDNEFYNIFKFDKVKIEDTQKNLKDFKNIKYYKGWIPDRFNEVENLKFSLVHIDLDLYKPTLDSISFFWPRVVGGGVMICDFHHGVSTGAQKATLEYFNGIINVEIHPSGIAIIRK